MADFSLNTLFVVPSGSGPNSTIASTGSTQNLVAGKVGFFNADYTVINPSSPTATGNYFYVAQGRENTYLQGTKRSDKIGVRTLALSGAAQTVTPLNSNVTEFYKISGCPTPVTQVTDVNGWNVHCGDVVTLTLRAHSSYLDTLYFNGFTRSVTVQAPCCDCGGDPCDTVDVPGLIDAFIAKLRQQAPGINPDNISLNNFFQFQRVGNDVNAILRISAKPLTIYGQPCDVAAFPFEFDRMYFRTFVYSGPATTADFIVADNCNIVANAAVTQRANYARGTSAEIIQLEKNFYSYQAGYLKHLFRMVGYNGNFESWVSDGTNYTTYYIKFNEYDRAAYQWGDYIEQNSQVIIAVPSNGAAETAVDALFTGLLGTIVDETGNVCITTTTSTTQVPPSTTTTTTLQP
jgi:hypothetical protein